MKKKSCNCINCKNGKIHNLMAEDQNVEPEITLDTDKAKQSFHKFMSFVIFLARKMGIFIVGLVIGMGVVLKDPPIDKKLTDINQVFKQENIVLKEKLDILQKTIAENKNPLEPAKILEDKNAIIIKESLNLK